MPKAFLSHSNKQKDFVEKVALQLGHDNCVYDKFTFEAGMDTLEEIINKLQHSDLFVIFLSDSALESDWVKKEILIAEDLIKKDIVKKVYPILIDSLIKYDDVRIPGWIREKNIRYVNTPHNVSRLIQARLRELSWNIYPKLREKEKIFIGRNKLVDEFEERVYSFSESKPVCIFAAGIPGIGRRTFLKHSLLKTNIIYNESYNPPQISLDMRESIEDFIIKIFDLGFSLSIDITDLMTKSIDEKINLLVKLIKDIQDSNNILLIEDYGGIVLSTRDLSTWFEKFIKIWANKLDVKITLCIASNYKLNYAKYRNYSQLFQIEVPDLNKTERAGLFERYLQLEKLKIEHEHYSDLIELFDGFPEQIYYCVLMIKHEGLYETLQKKDLILNYNADRIVTLISKFEGNNLANNLLAILAEFDFISHNLLFEILEVEIQSIEQYRIIVGEFLSMSICELIGLNKEYYRLNDAIRNFVKRGKFKMPLAFRNKLRDHVVNFLKKDNYLDSDISEFFYSLKGALINGYSIHKKFLIPSHFLKTMIDLYQISRDYSEVIELADRVLENEKNMDSNIAWEIRYWLCLSLARLKNDRFLKEVQYFKGYHHNFLLGFYYRMIGKYKYCIEEYKKVFIDYPNHARTNRELVEVYILLEDYDEALLQAHKNYENDDKSNPFHIKAYFDCLIRNVKSRGNSEEILQELLENLSKINTDKAREMTLLAKADYQSIFIADNDAALKLVDEAIAMYKFSIYPIKSKFAILEHDLDIIGMEKLISDYEKILKEEKHVNDPYINNSIKIMKAKVFAYKAEYDLALSIIDNQLKFYPEKSKEFLRAKIIQIKDRKTR